MNLTSTVNIRYEHESVVQRWALAVERFAFSPASPMPLAIFRMGLAVILLLQAAFISSNLFELYGPSAILQGTVSDLLFAGPDLPSPRWWVQWFGVSNNQAILGTSFLYLASLMGLLLGWNSRLSAIGAWFSHLMLMTSGHSSIYGVDQFAHISLFYLIWAPSASCLSIDRWLGRTSSKPTVMANFFIRLLQLHLCIAYLASGIEKGSGPQWWNGEAIWRALNLPLYSQINAAWLAKVPWAAKFAGWSTLVVEAGYPFGMWFKKTRMLWVLSTIGLHFGIGICLGLWTFSLVMALLTFCAFGLRKD